MVQLSTTRPSLLVRIRNAADAEAWEQFLELYAPLLHGYFRRRGLQDADAADLTQEVLQAVSSAAMHLNDYRQRGTFRGWLYGVARNKYCDFRARQERHRPGSGDTAVAELIESVPAAGDEAAEWEREYQQRAFSLAARQVRECVDESTWQAFWQTAVEGRSGQEVARALEMSVGAVYVAKSRVLARLKQEVELAEG